MFVMVFAEIIYDKIEKKDYLDISLVFKTG
jgi:hypothetical protein